MPLVIKQPVLQFNLHFKVHSNSIRKQMHLSCDRHQQTLMRSTQTYFGLLHWKPKVLLKHINPPLPLS